MRSWHGFARANDTRLATLRRPRRRLMSRARRAHVRSSALALAHVAAGRLDAFWMASLRPWDIAAGALLVQGGGGRIGDLAGGSQYLRTSEVIAASPGVFNA
jgi:myo-inositol-1(or 4)-monophosphatase